MTTTESNIEKIIDAGLEFEAATPEESDVIFDRFRDAVLDAIREALPEAKIDGGPGSFTSEYYDVSLPGRESVQVRISTHRPAYSGPVWSFQPADAAKHVRLGIETVVDEANKADEIDE